MFNFLKKLLGLLAVSHTGKLLMSVLGRNKDRSQSDELSEVYSTEKAEFSEDSDSVDDIEDSEEVSPDYIADETKQSYVESQLK